MDKYTRPTETIDFQVPEIEAFIQKKAATSNDPVTQAVKFYYAVRDGIRYDPYAIDLSVEGLKASSTLRQGRGWCVAKAILLAACCRYMGISARLGFADVKNHLSTERMRRQMNTDIFYWHAYTSIYLNGKWVKATPAFNIELCKKFDLKPLEFDGENDSIFHSFDLNGNRHMEYINFRGEYEDVPLEEIRNTFNREYQMSPDSWIKADFDKDVEKEFKK